MHKTHTTSLLQSGSTVYLRDVTTVKNTISPFIPKVVFSLSLTSKADKVRLITNAIPGLLADLNMLILNED